MENKGSREKGRRKGFVFRSDVSKERKRVLDGVLFRAARGSKRVFGYSSFDGRVSETGNRGRLKKVQAETWDRICVEGDRVWTELPDPLRLPGTTVGGLGKSRLAQSAVESLIR